MLGGGPLGGEQAQTREKPKRDPETAVIAGRVVDAATGTPIASAVVTATGRRWSVVLSPRALTPPRVSVMTGADGHFSFNNLMAGAYALEASKPGFIPGAFGQRRPGGSSRRVELEQGERASVVIALWRYAAITGTILDEMGEPIVGQEVRAHRRVLSGGRLHLRDAGGGWTDDRGVYRIAALLPGAYIVGPAITQHAAAATLADASDQAPEGTAIVRVGSTLHIIDVDSAVAPVIPGGDRLLIYPEQFYAGVPTPAQATLLVVGSGEERANVDFQFLPIPAMRVSGRAYDGFPGLPVTLRLFQAATGAVTDAVVAEAYSDANGVFMFPAVPPGDYVLKALSTSAEDNRWAVLGFSIGQRDITDLDFTLGPGLRITGRVEFDGNPQMPFRNMHVAIEPADGSVLDVEPAAVTPGGRFTIDRLPAGNYVLHPGNVPERWMLRSIMHDGRDVTDAPLPLTGHVNDVVITLTNRMTELHGTALTAAGAPNPDAAVVLFPADREGWRDAGRTPRRVRSVRPDNAGEFSVSGLPSGDYFAVAVPAEELDEDDPSVFARLASVAERVGLEEGVRKEIVLRTRARSGR